jgi:hypothetical protein
MIVVICEVDMNNRLKNESTNKGASAAGYAASGFFGGLIGVAAYGISAALKSNQPSNSSIPDANKSPTNKK